MSLSNILTVNSNTFDSWKKATLNTLTVQTIIGWTGAGTTGPTGSSGPTGPRGSTGPTGYTGSSASVTGSTGISVLNSLGISTISGQTGTSWTPIFAPESGFTASYTEQAGKYYVIGNLCIFNASVKVSGYGGYTGIIYFSMPPFTPLIDGGGYVGQISNYTDNVGVFSIWEASSNPPLLFIMNQNLENNADDSTFVVPWQITFGGYYFF